MSTQPAKIQTLRFPEFRGPKSKRFMARAFSLGERLDFRLVESEAASSSPRLVRAGADGAALVFRYGAVVLINLTVDEERDFLQGLADRVRAPFGTPEREEVEVEIGEERAEGLSGATLTLREASLERLQVIAEILAKSVVLAQYEAALAGSFDTIEPLASALAEEGRINFRSRALLSNIGHKLLIQHRMVGRVQVLEKPELLWDRPDLERLYLRLEDEYELEERHVAIERKLGLISETSSTLLEVMQTRRMLRVEWYITSLIVVEVLLTLYDMFLRR